MPRRCAKPAGLAKRGGLGLVTGNTITKGPHMGKPRIGIVLSAFGLGSEVWALRQAEGFADLEPVYFATVRAQGGYDLPRGRDLHLFGAVAPGFGQRVQRKLGLAGGGIPAPAVLASMRKHLLAADLDAVLCHFVWNAVAVQHAIGDALPIICHAHGRDVTTNLQWASNRRALARSAPHFAEIVTVGSHQLGLIQKVYPAATAHLIPCGAPLERFASHPVPTRAGGEPIRFVTVGRLSEEKGLMQTLEAFEMVLAAGHAAHLTYIGDGPLRAELETKLAQSPAKDAVTLTGPLPPEQVAEILTQSHVYVQHSLPVGGWIEGFGVALTEAGATGLPLISTRSGGIPDQVFEGENGFLVPPFDAQGQGEAMIRFAADEHLRQAMGHTARQVAQQFDSAGQTAKLETVLQGAIAG